MSNEKLIELSRPVAWFLGTKECKNLTTSEEYANWYVEKMSTASPLYSQEYVSALLAELEAKTKHVADMESIVAAAKCDDELWDAMAHRLKTMEAKLATPVRLPETYSPDPWMGPDLSGTWLDKWDVKEAIRAAGFTVGNE
ncbi:hypothetical protein [Serratia grimesii]|uniref:hypothetical protein n=1 Tax=Serratia grimesii TaxID=82995 RepID=UPI0039AEC8CA